MGGMNAHRELEHDLLELGPDERALVSVDLARRVGRLCSSDQPIVYASDREASSPRLAFMSGHEHWAPGVDRALDQWFRQLGPLAYDPDRPQPAQRNVALRSCELPGGRRATLSVLRDLFRPVGVEPGDQLRALLCEGASLLAWVGAFRTRPFTARERQALSAIVPSLQARLRVERDLEHGKFAGRAASVVLEHIAGPAFVLSSRGRVEELNSAGRAMLSLDRASTLERLAQIAGGGPSTGSRRVSIGPVGRSHGWLVILDAPRPPGELAARVARVAQRARLTPAQTRVLGALASGLTNRGIAAALEVSSRTVETHLCAIFDKLGVSSRAAALAVVLDGG